MVTMKVLRVKMSDDTEWDIPAKFIAEARTKYYSVGRGKTYKDGKLVWQESSFKPGSKEWEEEFKQSMQDDELIDWAGNNMNWSDVKDVAVRVPKKDSPNRYEDGWTNAEMRIVSVKEPAQSDKLVAALKQSLREAK